MKTFHHLLIGAGLLALALILGLLLAWTRIGAAAQAANLGATAQEFRTEVLLGAAYATSLIAARQRNDGAAEQECLHLLNGTLARAEELGGRLERRLDGAPEERREARELSELWRVNRDALDALVAGRAAARQLEIVREHAVRLVPPLAAVIRSAERRQGAAIRAARLSLAGVGSLGLALIGLALWRLHTEVFAGLTRLVAELDLLGQGAGAATLTPADRGELAEVTRGLNRVLEHSREADRTKDRFLAAMSHEIRTPMNGVIGFLGNLRETPLNPQQHQYVRVIESSARNLLRVINEILDFSKLAAGRMELEEVAFDLPRLADECLAVARQLVRGKPVKVTWEATGVEVRVVRGDPTRLRQVLDNLLGNAAKFTERGEIRLSLEARTAPDQRLELHVAVSDTGPGIAPAQQRLLFQPFTQAEAGTTRRYGGTGLGLCIVASLVELMGGEISVDSRPGEGTTFRFTLVTRPATPGEQVQLSGHYRISMAPAALRHVCALLVDDTPTNLFLMETICQSIGLPYRTATNGKEALDLATAQSFDLIFMDIQMPVMDGYEAIRAIRQLPNRGGTQIVALTASAFQEDVDKALGAGSTGFLAKPFERDQLLLCIAQHLDIPVERELRALPDSHENREDAAIRQVHDTMREQYRIGLGEIKRILAQTVADWRPHLDNLCVFARRGDWAEVRPILHRLKGQFATLGLPHVAERAGELSASLRGGQTEGLREAIEDLAADLGSLFRAIEQDVTVDTHPVPPPGEPQPPPR